MPLTLRGKRVLHKFKTQYGAKRGTNIFYGFMRTNPHAFSSFHRLINKRR